MPNDFFPLSAPQDESGASEPTALPRTETVQESPRSASPEQSTPVRETRAVDPGELFGRSLNQDPLGLPADAQNQHEGSATAPKKRDADTPLSRTTEPAETPAAEATKPDTPITVESLRTFTQEQRLAAVERGEQDPETPAALLDESVTKQIVEALPEGLRADQQPALIQAGEHYAAASVEAAYAADDEAFQAIVQEWEAGANHADVTDAQTFMQAHGDPEIRDLLNATGLGSHPAMVRMLAEAQRAMRDA